jgi:hypothetical protein
MRRVCRVLAFVAVSGVLLTIAGLPWVLIAGAELCWAPLVGAVALAISR